MGNKPKIFVRLDERLLIGYIEKARRTIFYAAPSITREVAEAIVQRKRSDPTITVSVIVDADEQSLRLGFGEIGGLRWLAKNSIEIRDERNLTIGVVAFDHRAFVFAPTPTIIRDPDEMYINAININQSMARWLQHAMMPRESILDIVREEIGGSPKPDRASDELPEDEPSESDVLSAEIVEETDKAEEEPSAGFSFENDWLEPEIGSVTLETQTLDELESSIESRPPKQFDHEREILVYNGHLQFIEFNFRGGRLASRTIRLPENLLKLVQDQDEMVEITMTCKLFENPDELCPELKEFEKKVDEVRRCYIRSLGDDLGSVILAKDRESFELDLKDLYSDLEEVTKVANDLLADKIVESKARLLSVILPILLENPDGFAEVISWNGLPKEMVIKEKLEAILDRVVPDPEVLIERMELRCVFKDVTWEMLNNKKFGEAIKRLFPLEEFTKLYKERNTIGERTNRTKRTITDDEWADEIHG